MNGAWRLWLRLRASLWFLPTLVVLASIAGAAGLVEMQGRVGDEMAGRWPRVFGAGAEGARAMLSSIATSMITVAGVVFSVTIVSLSLTSTQYSPRVLNNFMRDQPTQLVLGVFVGIFAYCLVVLRTVRGDQEDGGFIPSLAVLGGMVYAFGAIALLIYFIHHVARSIQASSIVKRIHDDTARAIDRMFPQDIGQPPPPAAGADMLARLPADWAVVRAEHGGYVTGVDSERLLGIAIRRDRVLRLVPAVGEFVVPGSALVESAGEAPLQPGDARRLRGCIGLGTQRTVEQDPAFGLQQLVDVAVKALSPGINDPTTACMCVDRLGALMARLGDRRMPASYRMSGGRLRVIAPAPAFGSLLWLAFAAVLHHSRSDPQVLERVLDALQIVAASTPEASRRRHLARVAAGVCRQLQGMPSSVAMRRVRARAHALVGQLRRVG